MDEKMVDENGEIYRPVTVHKRDREIVRVFDPKESKRNYNYVRLRASREQKRAFKGLSLEEKGFLLTVLPYMDWETNIIVGDTEFGQPGKPLIMSQVEELMGIAKNSRIKLQKALIRKKVIGLLHIDGKATAIVINPKFAFKGSRPNESLTGAFESEQDAL